MKNIKMVGVRYILRTEDTSEFNEVGEVTRELDKLENAEKVILDRYPGPNPHCDFAYAAVTKSQVWADEEGNRFYSEPSVVWTMNRAQYLERFAEA